MDGVRRLFRRRVEPVTAEEPKPERKMSPEEQAYVDEQLRRGWMIQDEKIFEADELVQRGEIARAFLLLTSESYRIGGCSLSVSEAIALISLLRTSERAHERDQLRDVSDQDRDDHGSASPRQL